MEKVKLTFDLVPKTAWNKSIYRILQDTDNRVLWKDIKNQLILKEERKCFICESGGNLEAHEFWEYDEKNKIQKLEALHHLCSMCHKIKHFGLWTRTDYGIEELKKKGLSEKNLRKHFCKVNNCSLQDMKKLEDEAFEEHSRRSQSKWIQDLGKYKFVKNFIKD